MNDISRIKEACYQEGYADRCREIESNSIFCIEGTLYEANAGFVRKEIDGDNSNISEVLQDIINNSTIIGKAQVFHF